MNEIARQIEAFLLERGTWVRAAEICERFGVRERQLRAIDGEPGLCTEFAISGDKGFRHIETATPGEWDRFYSRIRQHGIGELVRVRKLRRARQRILQQKPSFTVEKDSGQLLFA